MSISDQNTPGKWLDRATPIGPPWSPAELPPALFHYTDASALLSILQNATLWASDYRTLNDYMEGDLIRAEFGPFGERAEILFVTSLSTRRDQLSQWRAYGAYALELDPVKLGALSGFQLVKCEYFDGDEPTWDHWPATGRALVIEKGVREHIDLASLVPSVSAEDAAKLVTRLILKQAGFREEDEWRLVAIRTLGDPSIRWRSSKGRMIPYLEVPIPDAMTRVVVGPQPRQEVAYRALDLFRKHRVAQGMPNIEVVVSGTTYTTL
jgi:hypothetical protein